MSNTAGVLSKSPGTGGQVIRGVVFAALGGICWGFSGTCAQLMTAGMGVPVSWITCVRLLLAAVIFLVVCSIREPRNLLAVLRDGRSLLRIAAFSILGVLLTQASYLSAISYTNAGVGTVLERIGLVFIMLYVCVRARRLPRNREIAGLVLAIVGTFLIATKGAIGSLAIPVEGLAWGILSAFALACYTLIPGKVLEKWGSLIVTGLAMLLGGLVASVVVRPWEIKVQMTPELVGAMLGLVVVGTIAAYLFYLQGITDAGPVRAGLVGCVEPVAAMAISALWLGTPVLPVDIVGCAMIVVMVLLSGQSSDEPKAAYDGTIYDLPPFEGRASELGYYVARPAMRSDYDDARALLGEARRAMMQLGIHEGMKRYPSARRLMRAVGEGTAYVVTTSRFRRVDAEASGRGNGESKDRIIGMFAVDPQGDAAYRNASGAHWLTEAPNAGNHTTAESPYAALHWVVVAESARRRGVGRYILGTADRVAKNAGAQSIRCDVYVQNAPMHALLLEHGYELCGEIELRSSLGHVRRRAVFERIV